MNQPIRDALNRKGSSVTELAKQRIPHPVFGCVIDETTKAMGKHPPLNSAHEAYAVIFEELNEFWDEVRKQNGERDHVAMHKELVQVAAMACRAIIDLRLT